MDNKKTKDSGIEWIGEIPEDWGLVKSKYIVRTYTGNSIKDEEKSNYEDKEDAIPYIATKDINAADFTINNKDLLFIKKNDLSFVRAEAGDTLMCIEGGSAGRKKTYLREQVCFVNKLCCFHPTNIVNKYLYYSLQSPHYEEEFKLNLSGLIGGVSRNKIDNFVMITPPQAIQHQIAEYLDKKCSQIDELIANNQSQIDKLKEYKQSVITQAVTKGLDPNVETKDSGIDWIGQIPKTWEVVRIKNIAHFNPVIKINQGIETISYAPMECVKNGWLIHKEISVNNISSGLTLFEENDIVMAKVTPCFENGNIAIATDLKNGIACGSSELFVFRSKNKFNKWLFYFLRNNIFKQRASATMTGTGGLKRVSPKFVSDYSLALPSLLEQQQIADYLDKKCSQIDSLIEIKQQKIEKLQEYKKSLIYEYVTGKKEVG